ncbi:MAG: helicase-related protein [Candidatus Marinamargulisbacteria bacterium]
MSTNPLVTSIESPQFYYEVHSHDRFKGLCRLLDIHYGKSIIVFCRTKKDVDHTAEKLLLLNYRVASYHGDLSPSAREKALISFTDGASNILLLTDIPAQIDGFPNIDVIVFSVIPQDPDSYIQRIIRLESSFKVAEVLTLISSNEFKKIAFIKRVTKSTIEHKQFLEPDDMIKLKTEHLINSLNEFDYTNEHQSVLNVTDELVEKFDPKALITYFLTHGINQSFDPQFYKDEFKQKSKKSKSDKANISDGNEDGDGERLFIAIGKADGITDTLLIDFLHSETNIQKDHFSEIKIFETFSFFKVANNEAEIVLEIFRRKKRGKRSIVERAKGKDAPKRKN